MKKVLTNRPWSNSEDVTMDYDSVSSARNCISKFIPKTDSERINNLIDDIRIKRITTFYARGAEYAILGDERTLQDEHLPEARSGESSDRRRISSEFVAWDFAPETPLVPFRNESRKIILPGTKYYSTCGNCNGDTYLPCGCGTGFETCYSCYGSGHVNCNRCGGRGQELVNCSSCGGRGAFVCSSCRGSGREVVREFRGTDPRDGQYIYEDVYYSCSACGGRGEYSCSACGGQGRYYETCSTCGGRGDVTCSTCGGGGDIVCRSCGGSLRVTCGNCNGCGSFVDQVALLENVRTHSSQEKFPMEDGYDVNLMTGNFDANRDTIIYRVQDTDRIIDVNAEQITDRWNCQQLFDRVSSMERESDTYHYVMYVLTLFERRMLNVFYEFNGKEYRIQIDTVTGNYYAEGTPLDDVGNQLVDTIVSAYEEKRYADLGAALLDYETLTPEEKDRDKKVVEIDNKTWKRFVAISLIGPAVFLVISFFTRRYMFSHISFWLSFLVQEFLSALLTEQLWKKFAGNKKYQTEYTIITYSFIISILIKYVLHWF